MFKKRRVELFIALLSFVMVVAVLEIVFRCAHITGEYHKPRIDIAYPIAGLPVIRAPYGVYTNTIVVSQYDSDPRAYFEKDNTIAHQHNSVGWRDNEIAIVKPDNVFRILGLGDSYLWGQGVKRKDICLTKLQEYLQKETPLMKIETMNAGVSCYNTTNERDQLAHVGLNYSPDLVIVHYVLNDVEEPIYRSGPKIEFFNKYTEIINSSDWLSGYSYVWSWGRQRILNSRRAKKYIQECVSGFHDSSKGWIESKKALADIKHMCDSGKAKLLVVIFPFYYKLDSDYPFARIHELVSDYCLSHGIDVLDLRDSYQGYKGPELWVHPSDQHPNEIAHDIAAKALSRYINSKKIVQKTTSK